MVDLGISRLVSSIDKATLDQIIAQLWQSVQQLKDDPVRLTLSGVGSMFGYIKAGQFVPPNVVISGIHAVENTDAYQMALDLLKKSARKIQEAYASVHNRLSDVKLRVLVAPYFALDRLAYGVDYLMKRATMSPELVSILEDEGWDSKDGRVIQKLVSGAMSALGYHDLGSDYNPKGKSVFSQERKPVLSVNFAEGIYRPLGGSIPHRVREILRRAHIHPELHRGR